MVPVPAPLAGNLSHGSGTVRLNHPLFRSIGGRVSRAPAEALFVFSALSQYVGAVIAVDLFDEVAPRTVAWIRVMGAAAVLVVIAGPRLRQRWTRQDFIAMAVFGIATSLMNTFFYIAIDRLPLGKGVAIEFIGPITVAAVRTRTRRNAWALFSAAAGVIVLSGIEVANEPFGLVFIFLASAMWAAYIVVGSRVAQQDRGTSSLALGLLIGAVVLSPIGAPGSGAVWTTPRLLLACMAVGVLSNVIGYGIDQSILRRIPVRRFSVLLALLPVTAMVVGFVALDQTPNVLDLFGIALVLTGVIVQEREVLPRST